MTNLKLSSKFPRPVSDPFASYASVFGIIQEFFQAKGRRAREKSFAGNAHDAYRLGLNVRD